MNIIKTKLPGVLLIEPKVFADNRGYFFESYQVNRYQEAGIAKAFVQDNVSYSTKGVVRGLHYQLQHPQGKLVTVISGAVLDVVVDVRPNSPTFKQWLTFELTDKNHHQVYIPEGYAHGFSVLSSEAYFLYKCTDYYYPAGEFGLLWNDPELNINWQVSNPILSEKDKVYRTLKDITIEQLPIYEN